MAITADNLDLIRYIQQKRKISLEELSVKFNRTSASIRREIYKINREYQDELILIKNALCFTKMTYDDLADFIASISIMEYQSLKMERINMLIIISFFDGYVNTTQNYTDWGISLTTKKNDTAFLREYLKKYDLAVYYRHKKGLVIEGDDFKNRILVCNILYALYDIDGEGEITQRVTNTPIERFCYRYIERLKGFFPFSQEILKNFLHRYQLKMTSLSEKFGILFISLYLMRGFTLYEGYIEQLPFEKPDLRFSTNQNENAIYNIVLPLLDYSRPIAFPKEEQLLALVAGFVYEVIAAVPLSIYTINDLIEECYNSFYKQILSVIFHIDIPDRLINHLDEEFEFLFLTISENVQKIQDVYKIQLTDDFYITLTLIFQKYIFKNMLINNQKNTHKKKVVIISHSTYERIDYFMSQIKEIFEIEFISILNLSQRIQLSDIEHDYVFSFSERIYRTLKTEGRAVVLLHFFLGNSDIEQLTEIGFHKSRNKFLTEKFVQELENKGGEEKVLYLKTKYSDFFI